MVFTRSRRADDRRRIFVVGGAAATGGLIFGGLLEYFLDPRSGRRRRHTARDRAFSQVRHGERRAMRRARRAESRAFGLARRTVSGAHRSHEPIDDVTLAQKVQSELYRRVEVPKGQVTINAEAGVVFLRGTIESRAVMARIESAVREVAGVRDVENLLHVPGTPAPHARSRIERERTSS